MLYFFVRWLGQVALHWFYRRVIVIGADTVSWDGPMIVAANHPNALVDTLLVGHAVPRRLRITAKATLADSAAGSLLFRALGIIPLRRVADEQGAGAPNPTRNRDAFRQMTAELARGGAVLIFPEGKSHNARELAPLKSGLARAALRARDMGVQHLQIVPVGLSFERKGDPESDAMVHIATPIVVDASLGDTPDVLTALVTERLAAVSHRAFPENIPSRSVATRHPWPARLLAAWGRWIHRVPIEIARRTALARSQAEDDPAMYTMTYAAACIGIWYLLQSVAVGWLFGAWWALAWVTMLIVSGYSVAYA